LKGNNK